MSVDEKTKDEKTKEDLSPGTWVTESTGFASVPPRATSDLGAVCEEEKDRSEDSGLRSPDSGDLEKPKTEDQRP
jgi:hypothetical protein